MALTPFLSSRLVLDRDEIQTHDLLTVSLVATHEIGHSPLSRQSCWFIQTNKLRTRKTMQ